MATHLPDPDPSLLISSESRLHDAWLSYEQAVVPPDASAVQRSECRRAFYGGAQAIMEAIIRPGLTEGRMEALRRELNYFVRLVERGQA